MRPLRVTAQTFACRSEADFLLVLALFRVHDWPDNCEVYPE